ncbi:hypothetical protein LJC04_03875 [Ruminococcaceae bacterium OttesenSCG-928-O06]|nr:hypothetical protein [Ruminococcaceae bacterium OttesenSCG-928-O06]
MDNLIDRYIYDVTRRLPEKEGGEVQKELRANIEDMLPQNPTEADVEAVLYQLGAPAKLADQYRQGPMCLISPAVYSDYIRALKWGLPAMAGILMIFGILLVLAGFSQDTTPVAMAGQLVGQGFSFAMQAALQFFFWVTIGFVIADRTGYRASEKPWQLSDLPKTLPGSKKRIPLSDSIIELVFSLLFTVLAVLYCLGAFPLFTIFRAGGASIDLVSDPAILRGLFFPVVVVGLLSVAECIIKMIYRAWRPVVCFVVVGSNLICAALSIYILSQTNLFFMDISLGYGPQADWIIGNGIGLLIIGIIAVAVLVECITAVYKTFVVK